MLLHRARLSLAGPRSLTQADAPVAAGPSGTGLARAPVPARHGSGFPEPVRAGAGARSGPVPDPVGSIGAGSALLAPCEQGEQSRVAACPPPTLLEVEVQTPAPVVVDRASQVDRLVVARASVSTSTSDLVSVLVSSEIGTDTDPVRCMPLLSLEDIGVNTEQIDLCSVCSARPSGQARRAGTGSMLVGGEIEACAAVSASPGDPLLEPASSEADISVDMDQVLVSALLLEAESNTDPSVPSPVRSLVGQGWVRPRWRWLQQHLPLLRLVLAIRSLIQDLRV